MRRGGVSALLRLASAARGASSLALPLSVQTSIATRGSGGRSSTSGIRACVFGSTGFLGRYVVNALARGGALLALPTRCVDNARQHLRVMGDLGQIVFYDAPHDLIKNDGAIRTAMTDCNVVVNLVGRDYETGRYTFDDVHRGFPSRLAALASDAGVTRLIHFSSVGAAHDAVAAKLRSQAEGEDAVRAAFPTATLVRPSPVFGSEDRLLRAWAAVSKLLPFVPLIDGGRTRMAPVEARDVAAAVVAMLKDDSTAGQTFSLGGPDVFTVAELVAIVFATIRESPSTLSVPARLARLAATPRDVLQTYVPFPVPVLPDPMYTRNGVDMFAADYVPPEGALGLASLGIVPRKLNGLNIDYLRAFRAGGYDLGATTTS